MTNDRTRNAGRNIVWGLVNKLITLGLPFVNRTVLVYVLGAAYLGLDNLFTSILQMLNIAELGFSSAVVYNMYKPIADENYVEINALLKLYKKVYQFIGIVVLLIGIIIMPLLPHIIKNDLPDGINIYNLYAIYLSNTVIGYWLFSYKKSLISAYQREDIISNLNSVISIIKTVFQITIVYSLKNYYIYILILPIITITENLLVSYLSIRLFPKCIPHGNVDVAIRKDIQKQIYGLMIQRICSVSRNSLDSIIISTYIGLNNVSIYGNYYYIMTGVHALTATIINSITATVGNSIAINSIEKNHSDMIKLNFIYMWLASNIAICLLCIFQPFMQIWMGTGMMLETKIVVAICVYFYCLCIGDMRSVYVIASGLWYEGRYRAVLEAVTNLILNIILGKYWGILGVVLSTLISLLSINFGYGSTIIYKYYFKNRKSHIYYMYHLYFAVITWITGLICYKVCDYLEMRGILQIVVNTIVCIIVTNCILHCAYCKLSVYKEAKEMCTAILKRCL